MIRTTIYSLRFSPIHVIAGVIKDVVMTLTIKPNSDTTQTRFSKNLQKTCTLIPVLLT